MHRLLSYIIICVALLAATTACSRHRHDERLEHVYALSDSLPGEALAALDSIDPAGLRSSDIPFYNLLRVKTADKNYRDISADSFIPGVIEHFENFGDARLHAEALYYVGRVSNDAGDYPTAIRYYQHALDILPDNDANLHLRGCIVSQTASLLRNIMLYKQSLPYIEESIEIDRLECDTLNLVFDNIMLAATFRDLKNISKSDSALLEIGDISANLPESDRAYIKKELANNRYESGDVAEALNLIRRVPETIDSLDKNNALVDAALIYLGNDLTDTAYVYADYLIRQSKIGDRRIGYFILLDHKMKKYSSEDSLDSYLQSFIKLTNDHFRQHDSQAAIMQNSYYNYSAHEKAKIVAVSSAKRLQAWLYGVSVVALGLIITVLIFKYRNKSELLRLHEEIETLRRIKERISDNVLQVSENVERIPALQENLSADKSGLRERRRAELIEIYNASKDKKVDERIVLSETRAKLEQYIKQQKNITGEDPMWQEIEMCVLNVSPEFHTTLLLLSGGRLNTKEYRTALLIKCGVTPTQMKTLLNLEKGSISSRRASLSMKIFDEKRELRYVDGLIRAL